MSIFHTILFLIFVLPVVMLKELWKMLTKNMTKAEKKKLLWYIPYVLIFILLIVMYLLWSNGYR